MQCTGGESCKTVTLLSHSSEVRIGKLRIEFFSEVMPYFFIRACQDVFRYPVCKLIFVILIFCYL